MNLDTLIEGTCFDHSRQVARISTVLAQKAGYTPSETAAIEQAALYHDIGKTSIPDAILNKPGPLTPEEFAVVKTHTELGYQKIAEAVGILTVAGDVCRDHHERPDGAGYGGLCGSAIHPYAKLISVADVFDALYSKRAYKDAWDIARIRAFFQAQAGTQFDAEAVKLLFSALGLILPLYQ